MGPNLALIALVACVVPSALGQTFQYSRGWTNGKRNGGGGSGLSPKETACELHRIKALLEGKPLTPYFWPCTYRLFSEPNERLMEPVSDVTKIQDPDSK
ncbi:Pro-corazonin [Nesidiocoris tenuis]|uniref:Pro-corazonin n=1 Tax=Nesidiocoris tenuis TaxID=355587 RepID=A0ABN7AWH6_9HEMI|nr:Pro-corazonin [Nesidiocoris tenuis]